MRCRNMKRNYLFLSIAFIAALWTASSRLHLQASPQQQQSTPDSQIAQHHALIDKYCVTCHNERTKTAGLALESVDISHPAEHADIWEKVIRKVRAEMMPPVGAARPEKASLDGLTSYLETSIDKVAAAHPNPGRATLHRLNRAEYGNAVRDLFALDAVDTFPLTLRPMGSTTSRILWVRLRR